LFLPGAKQMGLLAGLMGTVDFWRLQPDPKLVAVQPGEAAPHRYISGASTEKRDLSLAYVPEERTLEVALNALPPTPSIKWFNPPWGQLNNAVAVVKSQTGQFPTPEPGDWVLVIRAGK